MRALGVFVVLASVQFLLRPGGEPQEPTALGQRFPGVVNTVLLGGFRPLLVQYLWMDVELSYDAGRYLTTLRDLRLLSELDRDTPRALEYMAGVLAYGLAPRERTPRARLHRILEALDILERAMARHPRDPQLPLAQGLLLGAAWSWEPKLAAGYRKRRNESPLASALAAFERAVALAPGAWQARLMLAKTSRLRGIEILFDDGMGPEVLRHLARARELLEGLPLPDAGPTRLAAAWEGVARGLFRRDPGMAAEAVRLLASAVRPLPPPGDPGTGQEDGLAHGILEPLMELGKEAAASGPAADALSLLLALHTIQALLDKRLATGGREVAAEPAFHADLRAAVARILERDPGLRHRVPPALRPPGR